MLVIFKLCAQISKRATLLEVPTGDHFDVAQALKVPKQPPAPSQPQNANTMSFKPLGPGHPPLAAPVQYYPQIMLPPAGYAQPPPPA